MTATAARYTAANTLLALGALDETDPELDAIAELCATAAGLDEITDVLVEHGVIAENPDDDPHGEQLAAAVHHALAGDQ